MTPELIEDTCSLASQQCVPCQGGVPAMAAEEAAVLLEQLGADWHINAAGHLRCDYRFGDFVSAMAFANKVGDIAEEQGHHPDLHVAWGRCGVEIWTHKIQGLTRSDFILAARVDAAFSE